MLHNEFFKKLESDRKEGNINLDKNVWYQRVNKYASTLMSSVAKEKFYKQLLRYLLKLELSSRKALPSIGLTYFKVGTLSLTNGFSYETVFKYLRLSYEDDEKWESKRRRVSRSHPLAKDMSAYRFMQVLKAFLLYSKKDPRIKRLVAPYLIVPEIRKNIHRTFGQTYNKSLASLPLYSLSWKPFDKLLGRNKYRALVEQNYRGALYLCQKSREIHRRADLAQYGIANAVITMCGATVEGILSKMKYLKPTIDTPRPIPKPTLGIYCMAYIEHNNPKPTLVAQILFLLSIRNQIHPGNIYNRSVDIDMPWATFVLRLTEDIIIQLASSSKKRKYKAWHS
ncbi:MAG TPA: hypothetical protein ENI23_14390 [bacterium]|nr:hypothetical protein [bacterium]